MPQLPSQCTRNFLGTLQKPAADTLPYRIDFSPWLASLIAPTGATAGETITAANVGVLNSAGGLSITAQTFNANSLHFQAAGGTVGEVCQLYFDVQTSNGNSGFFSARFDVL